MRQIAANDNLFALNIGVGFGNGGNQRLRIRMFGFFKDDFGRGDFDDFAEIKQSHFVAHIADDAQVMGDKQVGQAELVLQILQQIQDLRLHRDIKRRSRLIEDNQARLNRQRAGDANALLLAAAEFMGIAIIMLLFQANHAHEFQDALAGLTAAQLFVNPQRLAYNLPDGHASVQRGGRRLINHLDFTSQTAQFSGADMRNVLPGVQNLPARRLKQTQDALADGGFA